MSDDSDLVARLRQYEGQNWQTTACYNGLCDEAAATIERLTRENAELDAMYQRQGREAFKPFNDERKVHAETSAQLAKAREALRSIGYDPDYDLPVEHANSDLNARMHWFGRAATYQGLARAALAKAEGRQP